MSLYAIIGRDRDDSLEARMKVRAEHLARASELAAEGRLVLAGPFPRVDADEANQAGFNGSLIVAEFESLEDAQRWTEQDPYVTSGVFSSFEVRPFIQVLP
jgi:uncharacterized protein YciI